MVERQTVGDAGNGRSTDADQHGLLLPAAGSVHPHPARENAAAVGSADFVLPSDVVTDEAPPDDLDVSPRLPSVAGANRTAETLSHGQLPRTKEPHRTKSQRSSLNNLNESQRRAIEAAVNEPVSIIQGPPGTGKTRTAAAIVKEWLLVDKASSKVITKGLSVCFVKIALLYILKFSIHCYVI